MIVIIEAYLSFLILWVFYLAAMKLKAHRHTLTPVAKFFGYQVIMIGLVIDALVNIFLGTILFLDPPRELTLTSRLIRYRNRGGFRGKLRKWFCSNLLDMFDAGGHC